MKQKQTVEAKAPDPSNEDTTTDLEKADDTGGSHQIGQDTSVLLSTRQAFRSLISTASFFSLSRIIVSSSIYINMTFIGKLSPRYLAASNFMNLIQMIILSIPASTLYSVGIKVSQLIDQKAKAKVLQNSHALALIISTPAILTSQLSKHILVALGQQHDIAALAHDYLFPYFIVNIPTWLIFGNYQQFLFATKHHWLATGLMALNCALTTGLGYALTYSDTSDWISKARGFPLGMAISGIISLITCHLTVKYHPCFKAYNINQFLTRPKWKEIKALLRLGSPICLQVGTEIFSLYLAGVFTGWLGKNALSAEQIAVQTLMLQVIPLFSLAQAVGIVTGQQNKINQKNGRVVSYVGAAFSTIYTGLCFVLSAAIPKYLIYPFLDVSDKGNASMVQTAQNLLLINSVGQIFDGIRNNFAGALRGYNSTVYAMVSGILTMGVASTAGGYLFKDDVENIFLVRDTMMALGAGIVLLGSFTTPNKLNVKNLKIHRTGLG